MPKCFQLSGLKRSLFPCKSSPNPNHENYVMFSYDTSSSTLVNSNQETVIFNPNESPITSTMIEPSPPTKRQYKKTNVTYESMFSRIDPINEDVDGSTTLVAYPYADMEISRNQDNTVEFMQSSRISDYDDITIVKHNNSPVSNYANYDEVFILFYSILMHHVILYRYLLLRCRWQVTSIICKAQNSVTIQTRHV